MSKSNSTTRCHAQERCIPRMQKCFNNQTGEFDMVHYLDGEWKWYDHFNGYRKKYKKLNILHNEIFQYRRNSTKNYSHCACPHHPLSQEKSRGRNYSFLQSWRWMRIYQQDEGEKDEGFGIIRMIRIQELLLANV